LHARQDAYAGDVEMITTVKDGDNLYWNQVCAMEGRATYRNVDKNRSKNLQHAVFIKRPYATWLKIQSSS